MGIDPNRLVPPKKQLEKAPDYELPEGQYEAWTVFNAMWTQWSRTAGFTRVIYDGLDYKALEVVMRLKGIKRSEREAVFDMCRVMEDEAIKLRNK